MVRMETVFPFGGLPSRDSRIEGSEPAEVNGPFALWSGASRAQQRSYPHIDIRRKFIEQWSYYRWTVAELGQGVESLYPWFMQRGLQ